VKLQGSLLKAALCFATGILRKQAPDALRLGVWSLPDNGANREVSILGSTRIG
jgi:hypothetical protein